MFCPSLEDVEVLINLPLFSHPLIVDALDGEGEQLVQDLIQQRDLSVLGSILQGRTGYYQPLPPSGLICILTAVSRLPEPTTGQSQQFRIPHSGLLT